MVEITTNVTDRVIQEGDTFSLNCSASGDPTPEVTWLKDDSSATVDFVSDPRVSVTVELIEENNVLSTITVKGALPSDEGEYKCRIDNHVIDNQPVVTGVDITVIRKSN